jgi:hypothetical protein
MEFIKAIVKPFIPVNCSISDLNVACISTTNPVYLVFYKGSSNPDLVIRRADSTDVVYAHKITEKLFNSVGELIPEPVELIQSGGDEYAIQKGVRGLTWFQIAGQYEKETEWDKLRECALRALMKLHEAIMSENEWQKVVKPGELLRKALSESKSAGLEVSPRLASRVSDEAQKLDCLGEVSSYNQHGDFCLNNLIVDGEDVHVIDFEDFGMTSMPLYDEMSLALSLFSQSPSGVQVSMINELKLCTTKSAEYMGISSDMIPGLFIGHLLVKLGPWSSGERRLQYREWLISILEEVISEEVTF